MPLTLPTSIPIPNANIPYSNVVVSLIISPTFTNNIISAAVVFTATPYRTLPDGSIDSRPDLATTWSYADIYAAAANDANVATAITAIYAAIQAFITAEAA